MPSPVSAAALRQRAPRLAEAAVERARLTVVPRTRTQAAKVPFVSLVTLLLLGGVVGLLLVPSGLLLAETGRAAASEVVSGVLLLLGSLLALDRRPQADGATGSAVLTEDEEQAR